MRFMPHQQQHRSLKYEYELYVEREIEDYKDSIPRSAILSIGDEAVSRLRAQEQVAFDELVLWDEVDRIITSRLRIPAYSTWQPAEGSSQPTASAAQAAQRRPGCRDDPVRGDLMFSPSLAKSAADPGPPSESVPTRSEDRSARIGAAVGF